MTFVRDQSAQSTAARRTLQGAAAALLVVLCSAPAPFGRTLHAQTATVQRDGEPFFAEPRGTRLGRFAAEVPVRPGPARSGFTEVPLEGWMVRTSTQPTTRDGRDLQVAREENIRVVPNGRLIGRVVAGTLFDEVERRGAWVRVRRTVWVATSGLRPPAAATAPTPARPAPATSAAPSQRRDTLAVRRDTADPRRAVVRRRMNLFRAPDSTAIGTLEAGVPVRITGRAGPWVRVEAQAWVRETEIRPSDVAILTGVSAAELRGAPEEFRGRLLRWTIQFLAFQTADELRPDFTPGQRYILARGPAPEYAIVYVTVPPARMAEVERLAPLASVDIVARVVNGRGAYLANPILELVDLP
jgi:hypothetical protein